MLIVNADDWGRSSAETDAALVCFRRHAITSATAMVFMADSERAADLAREYAIPVGLHLNLTDALTGRNVGNAQARVHRDVREALSRPWYSLPSLGAGARNNLLSTFQFQCDEFTRLYGKAPSHFDGHRHSHLWFSMLLAAPIPKGQRVRRTFSFSIDEKGILRWFYRRALDAWVTSRYRTTDFFFALSQRMTHEAFDRVVQLAQGACVELMVHPVVSAERAFLLSPNFDQRLAGIARKSFADL